MPKQKSVSTAIKLIKRYSLLLFVMFVFTSFFSQDDKRYEIKRKIWVYQTYKNGVMGYKSQSKFFRESTGFQLLEKGKLRIRQKSSWPGMDPATYELANGEWEISSDSILTFRFKYLYEDKTERRKIVKLTPDWMFLEIME